LFILTSGNKAAKTA